MKTCALCRAASPDDASHAAHMRDAHGWTEDVKQPPIAGDHPEHQTMFVVVLLLVVGTFAANQLHVGEFWGGLVIWAVVIGGIYVFGALGRGATNR